MTKDELLKTLDKMTISEEQAIPIYTKHMAAILDWSGLSQEKRLKIKNILARLETDSLGHIQQLDAVRTLVKESDKNVF